VCGKAYEALHSVDEKITRRYDDNELLEEDTHESTLDIKIYFTVAPYSFETKVLYFN
jgi:hypothetical protein